MINLQKGNLFATNTKVKETAKKPEKKLLIAPKLDDKIKRWAELKTMIDQATAEAKMLEGDIKEVGRELFITEYSVNKVTPDSFRIKDNTGNSCLFICTDKYTAIDEGKAEILRHKDLLNENVTYKFNPELVEKYGQILSDLINDSQDIEEEDKANLISGELTFAVKKGAIDRLLHYENPAQIFELINPIVSIKK